MQRLIALVVGMALLTGACGAGADPTTTTAPATTSAPSQPEILAATVSRTDPDPTAPLDQLVAGFNDAGFDLLARQGTENFVFSPLSIGHALLMARGAADEATGRSIDSLFALPAGRPAHAAWNGLDRAIASASDAEEDVVVTIADRIWPRIGLEPDQDWVEPAGRRARRHGGGTGSDRRSRRQ
jgi:serine protease inhibitor